MGEEGRPPKPNRLPDSVRNLLAGADRVEVLSLDPERYLPDPETGEWPPPEAGDFCDWPVLGATVVDDPAIRRRLFDALLRGIEENTGWVAACFTPRHGLRATRDGASIELVICFECAQIYLYSDGDRSGRVLVSCSPEWVFDEVLSAAGVPLAPKPD